MTKEKYETIKKEYGDYASFAIWKSYKNVSDLSMFDDEEIVSTINDKYVFVALNPAEREQEPNQTINKFENFHSSYSHQKDFKLCYALQNTRFWGSYVTDLFKSFAITDSCKLNKKLQEQESQKIAQVDMDALRRELKLIGDKPILIALGRKTEKELKKLFKNEYEIVYLMHYSFYCSKEKYREIVLNTLKDY